MKNYSFLFVPILICILISSCSKETTSKSLNATKLIQQSHEKLEALRKAEIMKKLSQSFNNRRETESSIAEREGNCCQCLIYIEDVTVSPSVSDYYWEIESVGSCDTCAWSRVVYSSSDCYTPITTMCEDVAYHNIHGWGGGGNFNCCIPLCSAINFVGTAFSFDEDCIPVTDVTIKVKYHVECTRNTLSPTDPCRQSFIGQTTVITITGDQMSSGGNIMLGGSCGCDPNGNPCGHG